MIHSITVGSARAPSRSAIAILTHDAAGRMISMGQSQGIPYFVHDRTQSLVRLVIWNVFVHCNGI